jgi:hypothetical protein
MGSASEQIALLCNTHNPRMVGSFLVNRLSRKRFTRAYRLARRKAGITHLRLLA